MPYQQDGYSKYLEDSARIHNAAGVASNDPAVRAMQGAQGAPFSAHTGQVGSGPAPTADAGLGIIFLIIGGLFATTIILPVYGVYLALGGGTRGFVLVNVFWLEMPVVTALVVTVSYLLARWFGPDLGTILLFAALFVCGGIAVDNHLGEKALPWVIGAALAFSLGAAHLFATLTRNRQNRFRRWSERHRKTLFTLIFLLLPSIFAGLFFAAYYLFAVYSEGVSPAEFADYIRTLPANDEFRKLVMLWALVWSGFIAVLSILTWMIRRFVNFV